ncbi:MAG TPA: IS110 family transposase [Streptosporangiaceae bacterium]
MDIVHPRVAGLDVHKKVVWVAVRLPGAGPGERTVTVKRYRTFWRELTKMTAWLTGLGVTDAAMESTGVYWWPVYHALAQAGIEVCVCNAAHMRNVPGRKRDVADCQWIAELHEHGLLRPSFIPTAAVAGLRARTRYRKKLIEQRTAEGQRLSKVLEDAGIKIDSVASRLLGVSGRVMIEALIAGERDPGRLAGLAKGLLRRKTEELAMACDGRFTDGHGQMCRLHLDAHDHLTAKIAELDALIAAAAAPFEAIIARLVTIPGVGRRTAEVIVAETGGDMARFATAARLAAWAGLAPGDNESAGPPDPYRSSPAGQKSRLRRRCRAPAGVPKFRHRGLFNGRVGDLAQVREELVSAADWVGAGAYPESQRIDIDARGPAGGRRTPAFQLAEGAADGLAAGRPAGPAGRPLKTQTL